MRLCNGAYAQDMMKRVCKSMQLSRWNELKIKIKTLEVEMVTSKEEVSNMGAATTVVSEQTQHSISWLTNNHAMRRVLLLSWRARRPN